MFFVWYRSDLKNFRKREADFYKSLFQWKIPAQADSTKLIFLVLIGGDNKVEVTEFHPNAFVMKYIQDDDNTCCFYILASGVFASGEYVA